MTYNEQRSSENTSGLHAAFLSSQYSNRPWRAETTACSGEQLLCALANKANK